MSRSLSRWLPAQLTLAVVLSLSACNGASDADDAPGGSASTSTSSTSTPSPGTPSESVAVPEPTPYVEPADGKWMEVPGARIRSPKGWVKVTDYLGLVQTRRDKHARSYVAITPAFVDHESLDAFARNARREEAYIPRGSKRLDDVTIAGGTMRAFRMRSTADPQELVEVYGVVNLGGAWLVTFSFPTFVIGAEVMTAEERQQLMDSILATFENVLAE